MNILAAWDWHRITRFDVWSVLFWVNVVIAIGLVSVLVISLRRDRVERTPANLTPYFDDETLEGPHLERVLGWALFFFAIFAVTLPLYWLREGQREKASVSYFSEGSVKRGMILFSNGDTMPKTFDPATSLQCASCHGANGQGGGAAPFTYKDPTTGKAYAAPWRAPALNTVMYRFSPQEVHDILTYGRAGSPMQAWGVLGGGPKNEQSINDLVAYLESIQLPPGTQADAAKDLEGCRATPPKLPTTALGQSACNLDAWRNEPKVQLDTAKQALADAQKAKSDDEAAFAKAGCKDEFTKGEDAACVALRLKVRETKDPTAPTARIALTAAQQHFDALNADSKATADEKTAAKTDLDAAQQALQQAEADYAAKNCAHEPTVADLAACNSLDRALNPQTFKPTDDTAIATAQSDYDWAQEWSKRRQGVSNGQLLFETNCARCHTKNWSIFDPTRTDLKPEDLIGLPGGGGSLGFNLRDGATQRRFPDTRSATGAVLPGSGLLSQTQFVVNGDEANKAYGYGGIGSGRMPGQCNTWLQTQPEVKLAPGCMLSTLSTDKAFKSSDTSSDIPTDMIEEIVLYERCGLQDTKETLAPPTANYKTGCK